MKTALFWVVTQRVVLIPYGCFGTIFRAHLLLGFLTLEDGTDRLSRNVGKELALHAA